MRHSRLPSGWWARVLLMTWLIGPSEMGSNQNSTWHAPPVHRLGHVGRWLTDERGRVVLIHGGNVVELVGDAHRAGPGAGDNSWDAGTPAAMARSGFNGIRLVVFMDRVAPAPGTIDTAYLDSIAATVKAYASEGTSLAASTTALRAGAD